jgi:CheY-like chemotaxis protein
VFTFEIPYQLAGAFIVKAEPTGKADYSTLSRLHILVAEDNVFNQTVIKDTLENLVPGIEVDITPSGKAAVEKLQLQQYDLVLMDVHMPEMDGYEATRFIRNNLKLNLPIIALTASVIRGDLDKCTAAGMNGFIPKPFKRSELLDALIKHFPPNANGKT